MHNIKTTRSELITSLCLVGNWKKTTYPTSLFYCFFLLVLVNVLGNCLFTISFLLMSLLFCVPCDQINKWIATWIQQHGVSDWPLVIGVARLSSMENTPSSQSLVVALWLPNSWSIVNDLGLIRHSRYTVARPSTALAIFSSVWMQLVLPIIGAPTIIIAWKRWISYSCTKASNNLLYTIKAQIWQSSSIWEIMWHESVDGSCRRRLVNKVCCDRRPSHYWACRFDGHHHHHQRF